MSNFLFVVFLLMIPILWSKLSKLQRQVDELKTEVDQLRNGTSTETNRFVHTNSSLSPDPASFSSFTGASPTAQSELNNELDQELLALVRRGNKIQAIKKLREARNLSLKEAKDYVEALDR